MYIYISLASINLLHFSHVVVREPPWSEYIKVYERSLKKCFTVRVQVVEHKF